MSVPPRQTLIRVFFPHHTDEPGLQILSNDLNTSKVIALAGRMTDQDALLKRRQRNMNFINLILGLAIAIATTALAVMFVKQARAASDDPLIIRHTPPGMQGIGGSLYVPSTPRQGHDEFQRNLEWQGNQWPRCYTVGVTCDRYGCPLRSDQSQPDEELDLHRASR
jgi:hypothetical protein